MAQFSLPVLNTQYEKIQPIPTSNWMTALGQGADMVSKAAGQYIDYKDFQEEERKKKEAAQKRKELEALLNSVKDDDAKLEELKRKLEELKEELSVANTAAAQASMEGYRPQYSMEGYKSQYSMEGYNPENVLLPSRSPDESRMQMMEAFGSMTPNVNVPEETMSPINTFGFTPMVLPQLRG